MDTLTPADKAKILSKIQKLSADIAALEEARQHMYDTLATNIGMTEKPVLIGSNDTGWANVSIFQGKQFNADYLKAQAPEVWEKAAEVQLIVTSALAKKKLTDAEYALGQKPNTKTTVKVEAVNERD